MISYIFILFLSISIGIFAYKLFQDLLSITFWYSCSMALSILCAIIGLAFWNDTSTLNDITILIITLSLIGFFLGEFIMRYTLKIKKPDFKLEKIKDPKNILLVIELIFGLLTIILLYFEVKRIAQLTGYDGNDLSQTLGAMRSTSQLFTMDYVNEGQNVNSLVSFMRKICEALCFVNIFFIIKDIIIKKFSLKHNWLQLLFVCEAIAIVILTASRMQALVYIVGAAFIAIMLSHRKLTIGTILRRYRKRALAAIAIVLALFLAVLPLSGRELNTNPVSYLSFYFGTPIPSLNEYTEVAHFEPVVFGEETLRGLHNSLYKLNLSDYNAPISTEWLRFTSEDGAILSSNVFTSSKRFYHDFGWLGVFICQFLFAVCFYLIYHAISKSTGSKKVVLLIFFASYFYMVIDQVRDEWFFGTFLHINTIIRLVLIAFIYWFIQRGNTQEAHD